jgi:DNA repair protein RecN (Recombination protein N)
MIDELEVQNYAIIDRITVTLARGLNVLTGETGAGKSIIVGALGFALGDKVSDDVVRKGCETCSVQVVFRPGEAMLKRLKDALPGLECPNGTLTIERELARGGRSKSMLNGNRAALAQAREVGNLLVDFHGQHEHQLLLDARTHIDFLDGFAHLLPFRDRLVGKRHDLLDLKRRIRSLEEDIAHISDKEDFIRYEIREIEQLDLKEGEDESLNGEIAILENAEKILAAGSEIMDALYDGDEAAVRSLSWASAQLEKLGIYSENLGALAENLDQAEVIVKETAESLRDHLARIDLDPVHLERLRERQALIDRITRKYGKTVGEVLEHLRRLRQGLTNKEDLAVELSTLREEERTAEAEVASLASELSENRKAVAKGFEKSIAAELKTLGMEGGAFRVFFEDLDQGEGVRGGDGTEHIIGEKGMDSVEFFVRTNKGEDLLPLRRIASGGEVSRVMLGLKRILGEVDQVDAMVFDEVDAGIGGSMADVVGAKLREVSHSRQVICITHLPQIAAHADLHLAVGKSSIGGRTVTEVGRVEGRARVEELARMIGGKKAPESARLHAEEILRRAVAK